MLTRALHAAAALGDTDAVEALLARGADPTARGADGRTAAERVPQGDPSCDPEDVAAWRHLRRRLEQAAATASNPPEAVRAEVEVTVNNNGEAPAAHLHRGSST